MIFSAEAPHRASTHAAHVYFQPVIDLTHWRVAGFEALARFDDRRPPQCHLADATRDGLCGDLELQLIAGAVNAARELPEGLAVSVNASGTTSLRPELADTVRQFDRPWGLELLESPTTADLDQVRARVAELGGYLLADDAGTGAADATRIMHLQPDVVKVAREVFWRSVDDESAHAVLDSVLAAAREIGAEILIEGIENEQQVDRARELGAGLAQGFHFGKATPASEMSALLSTLHRRIGVDAPGL